MSATTAPHPLRRDVLLLLQVAMVVFVWTVVIGILNGADVVDFGRKAVLSHVHMGTLGWITICVFAASLWLFGANADERQTRAARWLARVAIVTLPAFALTFAVTFGNPRWIFGSFALATIVGFFAWVAVRFRSVQVSATHLGFLAALGTSVAGGTIGVLLATRIATGREVITVRAEDAHPATMVVGFLIPVGMALAEWGFDFRLLRRAGQLGVAQIGLPFIGGILLMLSLLLDIEPLAPLAVLIELAGVVIYFVRNHRAVRAVRWLESSSARFAAMSSIAIVANILFLNYLAGRYEGDFDLVPDRQLLALDHTMFVGVLTNAIFALLLGATSGDARWRRAVDAAFYGMNIGLAGFVVSLIGDYTWLERVSTPLMGASILAALVTFTLRLRTGEQADTVAVAFAESPA